MIGDLVNGLAVAVENAPKKTPKRIARECKLEDDENAILALMSNTEAKTAKHLADTLNKDYHSVYRVLKRLEAQKRIVSVEVRAKVSWVTVVNPMRINLGLDDAPVANNYSEMQLATLELMKGHRNQLTAKEVAKRLNTSESSAHVYLEALVRKRDVRRIEGKQGRVFWIYEPRKRVGV